MLEVQKFLQTGRIADLETAFGIHTKVYDDRIVLKYRIDSKPKFHPIVRECRGLVLDIRPGKMYNILARGFDRFFNYGEGDDKDTFHWDKCKVFNKLDGSLIKVYHDDRKWCASTSGTAFAEGETPMGRTFYDLFIQAIGTDLEHGFENCSKHHTYIFELTSPENRIVTRYHETTTTLLAVRNNLTGLFVDYDQIGVHTDFNMQCEGVAPSYDLNSPEAIIDFVEGRDAMDEGVVCFDPITEQRIKIKNASYVAIHHLRGNEVTKKSLLALVLKQEVDEYLSYFPEDKHMITPIEEKVAAIKTNTIELFMKYGKLENQKDFAMKVKDLPYSGFLFAMRKGAELDSFFTVENLPRIVKVMERSGVFK